MQRKLIGLICVVVVGVTLSLGLWPFQRPSNSVAWITPGQGLVFGKYGTVFSAPPAAASAGNATGGSIEVWALPGRRDSSTIVSLYRPDQGVLVRLRQSLTDLEIVAQQSGPSGAAKFFYVDEAFRHAMAEKRPVLITLTAGDRGTAVYSDGAPLKIVPNFHISPIAFEGRIILGDSPREPDSFHGTIRGLSLYVSELSAESVSRHSQDWIRSGRPNDPDARPLALYLFEEGAGHVVHNHAGPMGDLVIPDRYGVIDKVALEPFWREFDFSRGYWSGNVKNIVGFVPLGFCFYAYFFVRRHKRALLVTLACGFLVSLTIEVLQAALPSRDSGTTDLITNTLGTWCGVLCYRHVYLPLVKKFAAFGWLAPDQGTLV